MNCSDVQDRLSAYFDGELSGESRSAISRHLAGCDACATELEELEKVSLAVSGMSSPKVPPAIWHNISEELGAGEAEYAPTNTTPQNIPANRSWVSVRYLAIAASILLALGTSVWMMNHAEHEHEHDAEFVMTMDRYLKMLPADPDAAEQFLMNKYNGQTVNADNAVKLVGYRPIVAGGLPDGYSLTNTSVLKMPCCTCVKAVCKRQDGSTLVLFEHDDEETEWFGERPANVAMCGEKECCLVELDSSIAATWKQGSRSVTAVSLRDLEEVETLVGWLTKNLRNS